MLGSHHLVTPESRRDTGVTQVYRCTGVACSGVGGCSAWVVGVGVGVDTTLTVEDVHILTFSVSIRLDPSTPVPTPLSWDPGARTRSAAGSFFTCHKLGAVPSLRLTFSSDRM